MARTQILDTGGGPEQGFRRWFWDGLNQSLVPPPPWVLSVAQAMLILVANSLQNIAITEFNYSVCAMIVPNRLKFASFSYFQVNLPKLTWLIFLSHSKYDTVTPPAFKYKSCKIRISLKGAMSRYLLDLFKKLKRVVPSITWEKQYPSLYLAIATVFRMARVGKDGHGLKLEKRLANFSSFNVTPAKITKWFMVSAPLGCSPDDIFFSNSRGVFCVW